MSDFAVVRDKLRAFVREREWEQFHTPRNLLLALVGEVGELSEIFQWLTDAEAEQIMRDPASASRVREEIADVLSYLVRLADVLGIDLFAAMEAKIALNAQRYPVERAKGSARKHTQLRDPR